jgi:ankyrin repeat protein
VDYFQKVIGDIELHSIEGLRDCFAHGVSPNDQFRNEPLIYELTSEYTRSPRFEHCVKVFVDHGLVFDDKILLSVLANDATSLESQLAIDKDAINQHYTLRCAYTPLEKVTLLHICAEFNHVSCAEILVKHGADVNAKAGFDENGFGGHTPVFHTVNQNSNQSIDMLKYLLSSSADLKVMVTGLIWGKGYKWETLIPAVNPISYAMMGLLPQMHRDEITISKTVSLLLRAAYGVDYVPQNVPCNYLKES